MFVTAADFDLPPYNIPNLDKSNSFPDFVNQKEEEVLVQLFGRTLYNSFVSGYDALPDDWVITTAYTLGQQVVYGNDIWQAAQNNTGVIPVAGADWTLIEANNRWLTLANGDDYRYNERPYKWKGINKLLVPYIYSEWVRVSVYTFTGAGFVSPKLENGVIVNPNVEIVKSWNAFIDMAGSCGYYYDTLYGFLWESTVYDDVYGDDYDSFQNYYRANYVTLGKQNLFDL